MMIIIYPLYDKVKQMYATNFISTFNDNNNIPLPVGHVGNRKKVN